MSCFGTPEGTRTPDLLVRSQSLYPTELPAHSAQAPKYISTSKSKMQVLFFKNRNIFSTLPHLLTGLPALM